MLKQFCRENYKTAFWLVVASFAMTTLMYPPFTGKLAVFVKLGMFTSGLWVFLWLGNAHTSELVSQRLSWTEEPVKRFAAGMLVMVVYTVATVTALVWFFRVVLSFNVTDNMWGIIYGSLIVTFIISLFMHGRGFLINWKQAAIEAEQAKQESIKAQYESLRSQVNPHFLFNSLNALTNLVYEDQDKAAAFIKQLSEVYRYVLDTRDKEVVPVSEELQFLNAYLFLQKIRFGDKLVISIDVSPLSTQLPPLALQMLLENAIKHNIVAEEKPLCIRVFVENGFLVVSNNLQRKELRVGETSGIGLSNIRRRYEFLTSQPLVVEQTEDRFVVKLPLLNAGSPTK